MKVNHETLMRVALKEAAKAKAEGNIGVGSVIVRDGSVVARGRALVTSTNDPTAHAETMAIRDACAVLATIDLSDCTIYTTFRPCPMCCGAIVVSGIRSLVIGADAGPAENRWPGYTPERLLSATGYADKIAVVKGILSEDCSAIRI